MKEKIISILTLLLMAVPQWAWAQTGNVGLAAGTEDAANWSITPNTGVTAGSEVAISYDGNLKVNSLTAVETYIDNVLGNGSFDSGTDGWYGWGSTQSWDETGGIGGSGAVKIDVTTAGNIWDAVFAQGLTAALEAGKTYTLRFKVRTSGTGHVQGLVQYPDTPYPSVGLVSQEVGTGWTTIETVFTVPADEYSYTQICLQTGSDANVTYWIDDVELGEVKENDIALTEVEAGRQWTFTMPANSVSLQVNYKPAYKVSFAEAEKFAASEWAIFDATNTPIANGGLVTSGDQVTINYEGYLMVNGLAAVVTYIDNVLGNGSFDSGTDGWYGWGSTQSWDETGGIGGSGAVKIDVTTAGNIWDAVFAQGLTAALEAGKTYTLRFKVRASSTGHVQGLVQHTADPYPSVGLVNQEVGTGWTTIETVFTVPADEYSYTQICLQTGSDANVTYWIDDVELGEVKSLNVEVTEDVAGKQWSFTMPAYDTELKVAYATAYKVSFTGTNFVASEWTFADANGTPITSGFVTPTDQMTVINNGNRTVSSIAAVQKTIDNRLVNGSFDSGTDGWFGWGLTQSWDATGGASGNGAVKISVATAGNIYDAVCAQDLSAALEAGKTYMLRFKIRSSGTGRVMSLVQQPTGSYPSVGNLTKDVGTSWTTIEMPFTVAADGNSYSRLCFQIGAFANVTYWIDDVELGELNLLPVTLTEEVAGKQWSFTMPANTVEVQVACEYGYNATFIAANAHSIEAGTAAVTVDGNAATLTDGKLPAVSVGRSITVTAQEGFEFENAEVVEDCTDLSKLTNHYVAQDGEVLTGKLLARLKISIAAGATVTLKNVTIDGSSSDNTQWAGITCLGDATIILKGENKVQEYYDYYPGIYVPSGRTLTIQGTGSLTAYGDKSAGIGSGYKMACGNIIIEGGNITATSEWYGAGIGGAYEASCGNITIKGGTIIATGGYNAAAIGGGYYSSCGNITITDGVTSVTTTNGIGAGDDGSCGTVTIGGTVYPDGIATSPYTYTPGNTSVGPSTGSQTTIPDVAINEAKTTASVTMPDVHILINYTLLRNIATKTEFAGIPTEPIVVKKGEGDKYQPTTPLTYQLNDLLLEGAARNITQADGIAIHLEKVGDGDTWSEVENFLPTDNYVNGTYRLVATGTGLYKGTLASAAFTVIDEEQFANISYTIGLAEGISDAADWSLSANDAKAGETVTITYNGANNVKTIWGKKVGEFFDITPVEDVSNQWTFVMPVGNVEIDVDYYTQAGVILASSGNGGTASLLDASFKALAATDRVTENDRFALCVDVADGYDFNVSLNAGELEATGFSQEDYEAYLAYAKENNIAVPLNTMMAWVTMPRVETGDLTVTVAFQQQKTFTVLYQPTATPDEVWCRMGLNNDVTGMRYDVAKMKSDSELGDKTVWSVKASAIADPSKVAFFTSEEAAKNDDAFTSDAVISQTVDAWTAITGGQYLMIGGNAKTVVAAFVGDGSTLPVYDSETISLDGDVNSTDVRYQIAVCQTDAEGNVTTPGTIAALSAPATAPEGKTFDKWSALVGTAPSKIEMIYAAGQTGISISENTIFRAVWKPATLTATLNLNGGTGVGTTSNVTYNDVLTLGTPSREGFAFAGWTMSQSVSEGNELFVKGSPFDLGTPITANLGLTAQWKHIHAYHCFQITSFNDELEKYQKYNDAMHVAVCGCNDMELMAHTFGADGKCACGYEKPDAADVTLNISYGQWSLGNYTEKMQGMPETAKEGQEVSISAPGYWGSLQFSKWQYSTDGEWYDLTADAYSSFLIPCSMNVRALYVNPVTEPQVELSARQHDDYAEVNGKTYTMDNVLYQMNYRLPDGYSLVDAGIRMGDNGGISYYELKERTYKMDAEATAIAASMVAVTNFLSQSVNTFDTSTSEKYYAERENNVLDEMSAATLAEYMLQSKPVNVEKYPPIYWEAKVPTTGMSGSICTMPPLRFIQRNNGNHYIYGIGYLKYKTPSGDVKTICTDALPTTRDNIPGNSVTKSGESAADARQTAPARMMASRRAPAESSAEDHFDMRYVFAPETQLTVYVDGQWSAALSDSYGYGNKATITAPAVSGKTFSYWEADGQPVSSSQTLALTMNANTTLRAVYDGSAASVKAGFTSVTRSGDKISLQAIADAQATAAGIIYSITATDDALTIGGLGVTQVEAQTLTDATTEMPASVLDANNNWMLQIAPADANTVYHARVYATIGGITTYSAVRDVTLADLESGIQRLANLDGFEDGLDEALTAAKNTVATKTLDEAEDNVAWLSANDREMYDITLTRTLQAGSYNTFAVPFSIPGSMYGAYNLTDVKTLTDSEFDSATGQLTLNFADATEIEAGKPYLVKVSATVKNPAFGIVNVCGTPTATETTAVDFIPTLGKTLVTGPEGDADNTKTVLFLASGNKLVNPTVVNDAENPSSYIKGFRAYFQVKGLAAGARTFRLNLGDGETSGIESLTNGLSTREADSIYSLDGRRVQGATKKGVYIQNGKKVIIK